MAINKMYVLLFLGLLFVLFFFDLANGRGILTRRRNRKPKIAMLTILVRKHELLQRQRGRQNLNTDRELCTGKDCGVKPKESTHRHRHKHGYTKTKANGTDTKDKHVFKKKSKALPFLQTRDKMAADDASAIPDYDQQASYDQYGAGFGREFPRLQRPPAADRLERRLHPSIKAEAREVINTMDRVLQAMKQHLQQLHDSYDFVFNGTRYVMMTGAREGLQEIAAANKEVLDVILDTHLLTTYIYTRAHAHGLTGPTTQSLDRPHFVSLGIQLAAAIEEERLANQQDDTLHSLKLQCQRVDSRRESIARRMMKYSDKMVVLDLMRNINITTRTLIEYDQSLVMKRLARYRGLERLQDILVTAQTQVNVAKEKLRIAANNFRGNQLVYSDWKVHRQGSHGIAPVSLTLRQKRAVSSLTDIDISNREAIRIQVRHHISVVNKVTRSIQRIFPSLISEAKRVISEGGKGKYGVGMAILESKLHGYIKSINIAMDRIRLAIGDHSGLRERCEELEEGSGDSGESPIDCDSYIEEGSGSDGGKNGGAKPTISAPDTDFEFIGETIVDSKKVSPSEQLADKLNAHVKDLLKKSSASVAKAKDVTKTVKEEKFVLERIRNNINVADNYVAVAKKFTSSSGNSLEDAQTMDKRVQSISEKVRTLANVTRKRAATAVQKAEKKLKEVKGGGGAKPVAGNGAGSDAGSENQGRLVLTEAIELTSKAKNNIGSIVSLKREIPVTCGSVKQSVYDIRSNISHLRQKVQRARLALSTLQISISKTEGYVQIPMKSVDSLKSLVTAMEVSIRPQSMDGDILFVVGNHSQSHGLSLNGGILSYTVYDKDKTKKKTISNTQQLSTNTWYTVITKRIGQNVSLSVTSEDGKTVERLEDTSKEIKSVELPPASVFIGGPPSFPTGSYVWKGCVRGVRINGQPLILMQNRSDGKPAKLCDVSRSPRAQSMVFEGNGFVLFPTSTLRHSPVQTLVFEFRSYQADVLLMNIAVKQQRFLSTVRLQAGAIVITIPTSGTLLRSRNIYNNGVFHTLKITDSSRSPRAEVDGDNTFSIEKISPQRVSDEDDGLYVGGKPQSSSLQQNQDERWLIGCMRRLELNGNPLSMFESAISTGVYLGSCNSSSVWQNCVEFGDGSKVLSYEDVADGGSVLLAVSKTGEGVLLNYEKNEKYDIELEIAEGSIEITETVESLKGSLKIPEDFSDDFIFITITDSGSAVSITAMEQDVNFSYGETSYWGLATAVDTSPQTITIGGDNDDISRRFYGGITQLMIGSQYIDLHQLMSSNKLTSCPRQPVYTKTPVTDELVITC